MLEDVARVMLLGDDAVGELIRKRIGDVENGIAPGPTTDAIALAMWRAYAPRWCMTIETDQSLTEITAVNEGTGPEQGDDPGRFVVIARGVDAARTILAACERLEQADREGRASPGNVVALELPELPDADG